MKSAAGQTAEVPFIHLLQQRQFGLLEQSVMDLAPMTVVVP